MRAVIVITIGVVAARPEASHRFMWEGHLWPDRSWPDHTRPDRSRTPSQPAHDLLGRAPR